MHAAAVCTLLGINRTQLARWRREGVRSDGTYQLHGRGYRFDGELGKGAEIAAIHSGNIALRAIRSFSSV
jgi:ssDNA-binding replication factor A large subunit